MNDRVEFGCATQDSPFFESKAQSTTQARRGLQVTLIFSLGEPPKRLPVFPSPEPW
ncbi:hypothetical protein BC628DRAFT_1400788 [Trametes gibbosa]|nr:hypothetical protein BC628DRAFT_1400788 [Trametes gibbosa]